MRKITLSIAVIASIAIVSFTYKTISDLSNEYTTSVHVTTGQYYIFKQGSTFDIGITKNSMVIIKLSDTGIVTKYCQPISGGSAFMLSGYKPDFKNIEINTEKTHEEGYRGIRRFLPENPAVYIFNPGTTITILSDDSSLYVK